MLGNYVEDKPSGTGWPMPPFNLDLEQITEKMWTTRDNTPISGNVFGNGLVYSSDKHPAVFSSKDGIVWTLLSPTYSDQPRPLGVPSPNTSNQPTPPAVVSSAPANGVMINLNGKGYKLNLTANDGQLYEVQASTNLQNWVTLASITNSGAVLNFVDSDVTNYPIRFYRLKLQ